MLGWPSGAREGDRLAEAAGELRAQGVDVFAEPLNIRDADACEAWISAAHAHHGRLDVLVNNAGGQFPSPAEHISAKGWNAVIDTNLNGTWYMSRAFGARQFADQRPGRIINIVAAMWRGFPGMAHSGAARAGVVNLTKTLSLEWASRGILVNAVAPGVIRSSGLDTYPPAVQEMLATIVPAQIPLRRMGDGGGRRMASGLPRRPGGPVRHRRDVLRRRRPGPQRHAVPLQLDRPSHR